VRVICNGPGWVDPDSPLLAWCLEWTDPQGVPQRLLYGYGSGARRAAQAHADRLAGCCGERAKPEVPRPYLEPSQRRQPVIAPATSEYQRALCALAAVSQEGLALASLLDAFASLLRGYGRDPEAPFLEDYPSAGQVRRVLERRARALDAAREAWEALADEVKEQVEAPTR
jgi:hypothetical protein